MMRQRLLMLVTAVGLVAAACGASEADGDGDTSAVEELPATATSGGQAADPTPAAGLLPEGPSALDLPGSPEFPAPLVDPQEIISGGPPPDGIPPLDEPVFMDVVDGLEQFDPVEPVVALEINGDARAYPVQVMIWHEIVNDTVGGIPVSITYCPLCNSAVSYRREIRGVETTFGTSGSLYASALVMYDRATESLWTHFDGRAIVGLLAGEQLEAIPSPLMAWGDFAEAYPTGRVLNPEATGHNRAYGRNPYFGYDDEDSEPFLFTGITDPRAVSKLRVVGVERDGAAVAFSLDFVSEGEANATNTNVADDDVVIFWKAGQASALDREGIDAGRDVGSVTVFLPDVDGESLTFTAAEGEFVDDQTGSTWNLAGEATAGELEGAQLEQIPHLDTFWFAWATYQPGTDLVEAAE